MGLWSCHVSRIPKVLQGLEQHHGTGVWRRECESTPKQMGGGEASPEPSLLARGWDRGGDPPHLCTDSSCPCCCRTAAAVDTWGFPTTAFRASTKSLLSFPCREETRCQGHSQTPGATSLPLWLEGGVGLEWGCQHLRPPLPHPPLAPPPRPRPCQWAHQKQMYSAGKPLAKQNHRCQCFTSEKLPLDKNKTRFTL